MRIMTDDELLRCDGSVFCRVEGHVESRRLGNGNTRWTHIPLSRADERRSKELKAQHE